MPDARPVPMHVAGALSNRELRQATRARPCDSLERIHGRQSLYPVALEGALKLKEISYAHAEGYPAAELKHGPIALINPECPCIFLVEG